MPKVCYYKPNRTRKRVFTKQDVARIAKYAVDDGADVRDVAVGVLSALGLGFLICASAKAVNSAVGIATLFTKIGGALALGKLFDFLLTVVTHGAFKKLPLTKQVLAVVILVLAVSEGILNMGKQLLDNAEVITGSAEIVNDLCDRINALKPD